MAILVFVPYSRYIWWWSNAFRLKNVSISIELLIPFFFFFAPTQTNILSSSCSIQFPFLSSSSSSSFTLRMNRPSGNFTHTFGHWFYLIFFVPSSEEFYDFITSFETTECELSDLETARRFAVKFCKFCYRCWNFSVYEMNILLCWAGAIKLPLLSNCFRCRSSSSSKIRRIQYNRNNILLAGNKWRMSIFVSLRIPRRFDVIKPKSFCDELFYTYSRYAFSRCT